jgi:conjugative transposon TraN protein
MKHILITLMTVASTFLAQAQDKDSCNTDAKATEAIPIQNNTKAIEDLPIEAIHIRNFLAQPDQLNEIEIVKKYRGQGFNDKFNGLTKKIEYSQMIPPYGLEVTYNKTTHIIFPASIKYVDLGNDKIIAGVAGDAENVLRIKAAVENFPEETNMAVITDNGYYYTFNIKYAQEPDKLNIEMQDFLHDASAVNQPNNSIEVFLKELHNESPQLIQIIMRAIQKNNFRIIKHIGARGFGIQFLLKGIYSYGGMLYFHTEIKNSSSVDYNVDYLTYKIVDKKTVKRTTTQELVLVPVRSFNQVTVIKGRSTESTVFAIPIFTIMENKVLQVVLHEINGGRHLTFNVENKDVVRAREITNFNIN